MHGSDSTFFLLRRHRLFQKLTAQECAQLNIENGLLRPKKNEFVYFNKLHQDRVYFLKKGYVKIGYYDGQGNEIITEVIQEGDIFGQVGLDFDKENGEFAKAIKENAIICSFKINDFEKILEQKPNLAISFTKIVGLKFKRLQNRLSNIIYKDVRHRLLSFFEQQINEIPAIDQDQIRIENILTQAELACLIGSSRQTVTSLLSSLEAEGIIKYDRKHIEICSYHKLKDLLNSMSS